MAPRARATAGRGGAGRCAERGDKACAPQAKELEALSGSSAGSTVEGSQLPLLVAETSPAVEALEALDPDSLTPKQALEWIYRLKTLM